MKGKNHWVLVLLLGWGLAGCASGPQPLPRCEGPWEPINDQVERKHES